MILTVKDMIEALQELDPDLKMFAAIDDEGNGYNPVHYTPAVFYAHIEEINSYRLDDIYSLEDIDAKIENGDIEEEDRENYVRIAVI